MSETVIAVHVDLAQSFVDPNGSFYCGTTPKQLSNAAEIARLADWNLYCTDLHPLDSLEFAVNGGLYPIHNVPRPRELDLAKLGIEGLNPSPEPSVVLREAVDDSRAGIYVPRQVYFQGGSQCYGPDDVEATFGLPIITAEDFAAGDYTLVIQPKYFFDATRLAVGSEAPKANLDARIPEQNENVFSFIARRHPGGRARRRRRSAGT